MRYLIQSRARPIPQSVLINSLRRQRGTVLIVTLLMLAVILFVGMSAAQLSLEEEKSARNDRDHMIAFHAAEAALADAELDIENSPDPARSRSHIFSANSREGFSNEGAPSCQSGEGIYLGLCSQSPDPMKPTWLSASFFQENGASRNSVPYGKFTGQVFPVDAATLPKQLPQYVIEIFPFNQQGSNADEQSFAYRITAIGFGARSSTQVVLQSFYRKAV